MMLLRGSFRTDFLVPLVGPVEDAAPPSDAPQDAAPPTDAPQNAAPPTDTPQDAAQNDVAQDYNDDGTQGNFNRIIVTF